MGSVPKRKSNDQATQQEKSDTYTNRDYQGILRGNSSKRMLNRHTHRPASRSSALKAVGSLIWTLAPSRSAAAAPANHPRQTTASVTRIGTMGSFL